MRTPAVSTTTTALAVVTLAAGALISTTSLAQARGIDDYIPANPANYAPTGTDHYGWLFFRTPDGRNCGIAPNGGETGCDAVPYNAPVGKNQTTVSSWQKGRLVASKTKTYTRPHGQRTLPEGHKLTNQGTVCGMSYQRRRELQGGTTLVRAVDDIHGRTLRRAELRIRIGRAACRNRPGCVDRPTTPAPDNSSPTADQSATP